MFPTRPLRSHSPRGLTGGPAWAALVWGRCQWRRPVVTASDVVQAQGEARGQVGSVEVLSGWPSSTPSCSRRSQLWKGGPLRVPSVGHCNWWNRDVPVTVPAPVSSGSLRRLPFPGGTRRGNVGCMGVIMLGDRSSSHGDSWSKPGAFIRSRWRLCGKLTRAFSVNLRSTRLDLVVCTKSCDELVRIQAIF